MTLQLATGAFGFAVSARFLSERLSSVNWAVIGLIYIRSR